MNLNCKPDDLARIIGNVETRSFGCDNKIITVTRVTMMRGLPMWEYEGRRLRCKCGCGSAVMSISDDLLRPIGNPGDDEQDETLAWAPVPAIPSPARETVPA